MNKYTIADIRRLQPCYDPLRYLSRVWSGTAIDILKVAACPRVDRLWVVINWIDSRTLRLFTVWYARQRLMQLANPDPRSLTACDVAERFANGQASADELASAGDSAWAAARAVGVPVIGVDVGIGAGWDSVEKAAWAAAFTTSRDSAWAARALARDITEDAQIAHLIEMLEVA
jgi:hypothetical protein